MWRLANVQIIYLCIKVVTNLKEEKDYMLP